MPKTTITEAPVDAAADGGHFATMPKEVSYATLYIPCTSDDREDSRSPS